MPCTPSSYISHYLSISPTTDGRSCFTTLLLWASQRLLIMDPTDDLSQVTTRMMVFTNTPSRVIGLTNWSNTRIYLSLIRAPEVSISNRITTFTECYCSAVGRWSNDDLSQVTTRMMVFTNTPSRVIGLTNWSNTRIYLSLIRAPGPLVAYSLSN